MRPGRVKGAFARGLFDVTPYVAPGQTSALAVQILPPPHPGIPEEQTIAAGVGKNGGETARDGPTFLCTIGWDWIPGIRDRDMGLWQGVTLFATGPVTVSDPFVTSDAAPAAHGQRRSDRHGDRAERHGSGRSRAS